MTKRGGDGSTRLQYFSTVRPLQVVDNGRGGSVDSLREAILPFGRIREREYKDTVIWNEYYAYENLTWIHVLRT